MPTTVVSKLLELFESCTGEERHEFMVEVCRGRTTLVCDVIRTLGNCAFVKLATVKGKK
jgi:hypothetical protein